MSAAMDRSAPDYYAIIAERIKRLARIRATPGGFMALRAFYQDRIAQFISDWGMVHEPRNAAQGLPTEVPFILWPRQIQWIDWALGRWRAGEPGITEKTRDSGLTQLSVALSSSSCLLYDGVVVGFGSRKVEYVDGTPKSIFAKARFFLEHLPREMREWGGWDINRTSAFMRLSFPATRSAITGEGGSQIGRGDRTSLHFIDEAAFLDSDTEIDAALSATTRCRIDISTPNGMANSFARRRHSGRVKVFSFLWNHDPRKTPAWLEKQKRELPAYVVGSEILCDYMGSVDNQLIPAEWIRAAVDAHKKLGIEPTGMRFAAFDPADTGTDRCAFAGRQGILLQHLQSWSGKNSDLFASTQRAIMLCDAGGYSSFKFDGDGVGASCRGDARVIAEQRRAAGLRFIEDEAYRGSAPPPDPTGSLVPGRRNQDFFLNTKALAWWSLRMRFETTYRAIEHKQSYFADDLISLDGSLEELPQLLNELSQVCFSLNGVGRLVIDKLGEGCASPNLADACVMCYAPGMGSFFPEITLLA